VKMKKLQEMMKQAQSMQERLETEMNEARFEGSSGGGLVRVVMDGKKRVETVEIDPQAQDPQDAELLQDLIVKAFNDAAAKADEQLKNQVSGLAGGLLG
jgi:DNA-binding YbaB/EbfC family protein